MDIEVWLTGLGLEAYAEAFVENGVDAAMLPELTNEDLKDLGVVRLADRKRLLKAVAALTTEDDASPDPSPSSTTSEGERRQVTVLFADVTGFTQLSNELGAEETHAFLNRFFERVDGIIEGYGGTVDKHIGDNVMAVFGAPVAHSDDPERAARAALDIHEAMAGLSQELGRPLTTHIGIACGQVVASRTGSEAHREYTVTGDTVNLASRLQDQAKGGETFLSEEAYRAVASRATCSAVGELEVKGFATPARVWRLSGLLSSGPSEAQTPFVGRRSERRQFSSILDDCLETGTGQSVLLRGDAGIGKTRLLAQLMAMAEAKGFGCHKGLVLDFGVGKGQDAIRVLVRSLLGIPTGGGENKSAEVADSAVQDGRVDPDQRVYLNDLLDLPQPLELHALYDAMDNRTRNTRKQSLVAQLVERVSRRQPCLIALEDIHWADGLILAYLARIASTVATCPALLIMTSRVENDPLDQTWRSSLRGSPLTTIDLGALRDDEALEVGSAFFGQDRRVLQACIARAEGNPLFLEQLLRNAEEGSREEIPGSIQSLVQARMDRLKAEDREALQAASVIGQRFDLDCLRHLTGRPSYVCDGLLEHNLVGPQDEGFLFAHALIRDGVYGSLLKRRRLDLHRRAAEWFGDRDLALKAEHLDRAEDLDAPAAYLAAAESLAESYHYERARSLIERGIAIAAQPAEVFALTCLKGRILHDLGAIEASVEAYQDALHMAKDELEQCRAWLGLAAGMRISDRYDDALDALDKAEPIAKRHDLVRDLAAIHHLRGNLYFPLGRIDDCRREHEASLKYALDSGSAEAEAQALSGLGDAAYVAGRMVTAHDYFRRCVEVAHKNGLGRIEVVNRAMVGFSRLYMNQLREALEDALATVAAATTVGDQRAEMLGEMLAVFALYEMSEIAQAQEHNDRALALTRQLGAPRFESQCLLYSGRLAFAEGRREDCVELETQALEISRRVGHGFTGPRIAGALARALSEPQAKRATLMEGEEMLRARTVGHNHFYFDVDAIDVSLELGDWDEAERYATMLEDFAGSEPVPWSSFFAARGRALAAHGRGQRGPEVLAELRRLREEAERAGFKSALPALDRALEQERSA